jgi:hypothetical protein
MKFRRFTLISAMTLFAAMAISVQLSAAGTLCVNPAGSHNCFSSIQTAVNHASANDVINERIRAAKKRRKPDSRTMSLDEDELDANGLVVQ